MQLIGFDIDAFLRDHWQKRPLLIRNPWGEWRNPIEPDDLAGLACEEAVEARLVSRRGGKAGGELACGEGPFDSARFARLGKRNWTLLVQAVDHHVPEVAALIEAFRFVPNWRIDDVMVSYAADGGGVGPHFDQYDVFLIQGLGRRRWQVGGWCDAGTELLPHDDLRLLAEFEPREEWLLEPGDILYLPPRLAHCGVAVGDDCMTYSVGFRAPSRRELIGHWCEFVMEGLSEDDRFGDPDLARQSNPGEITPEAIARLHALLLEKIADRAGFARWFGRYSSTPKYPELDWSPEQPLDRAGLLGKIAKGALLERNPASRFSFIRQDGSGVLLFVDGDCREFGGAEAEFARRLCARAQLEVEPAASEAAIDLILWLYGKGAVSFEAGDRSEA